jgi:hypothetical protein
MAGMDVCEAVTQNEKIRIAVKAIRKYAQEHFGWDAKFHEDKKHEWDNHMEVIHWLESLKDGREKHE